MERSDRNQTIQLNDDERKLYGGNLISLNGMVNENDLINKTILGNVIETMKFMPDDFVDLAIIDPPYNMNKKFGVSDFKVMNHDDYVDWMDSWLSELIRLLKPHATVYICGDWFSSIAIPLSVEKFLKIRNRITFSRDKGRGSRVNWKNNSEDIWYCTVGNDYVFNVDDIMIKRKVHVGFNNEDGSPRGWHWENGERYRLTYPSNIWDDIVIPFWAMPENTSHPTQKPEKLVARLILASSNEGDMVFDPFLGSGTTSVVASKLGRRYVGCEIDEYYACIAEKRLNNMDNVIQGYSGGVFLDKMGIMDKNTGIPSHPGDLFE